MTRRDLIHHRIVTSRREWGFFFGPKEIAGLPASTGDGGRGMSELNWLKPPVAQQSAPEPRMSWNS